MIFRHLINTSQRPTDRFVPITRFVPFFTSVLASLAPRLTGRAYSKRFYEILKARRKLPCRDACRGFVATRSILLRDARVVHDTLGFSSSRVRQKWFWTPTKRSFPEAERSDLKISVFGRCMELKHRQYEEYVLRGSSRDSSVWPVTSLVLLHRQFE